MKISRSGVPKQSVIDKLEGQPIADCSNLTVVADEVEIRHGLGNPVVIADERTDSTSPNIMEFTSWSAGMQPPYQRGRVQVLAQLLGARFFAPNSKGQGEGSPDLDSLDKMEMRRGRMHRIGRFAVNSAFAALQDGEAMPERVHLLGVSQGPALVPGALERLTALGIAVDTITLATPASTWGGSLMRLGAAMLTNAPKKMKLYRSQNPDSLQGVADTNVAKSLIKQTAAHLLHYPRGMKRQNFADQLIAEIDKATHKPKVHIIAAEKDKVSRLKRNEKLVEKLRAHGIDAQMRVLAGQYHAVSEHTPLMAGLLSEIISSAA